MAEHSGKQYKNTFKDDVTKNNKSLCSSRFIQLM